MHSKVALIIERLLQFSCLFLPHKHKRVTVWASENMSRINNYTTSSTATAATTAGSSLWQFGREFREVLASVDEYQTWRANAFENQLRNANNVIHEDDDDHQYHRKSTNSNFNNIMPLRFSEMKAHHQPLYLLQQQQQQQPHDKWHKTLPPSEMLPRNEVLGGYIFVCNNETMQEDLRRQLFGNKFFSLFTTYFCRCPINF